MIRSVVKQIFKRLGFCVRRDVQIAEWYESDGLRSVHNHAFLDDPAYQAALARAIQADRSLGFMTWRLHVVLWAAKHALKLEGDFVECGVNRGFFSSAVMTYLDWNQQNRNFFLFDTFQGIATELLSAEEVEVGRLMNNEQYTECYERTAANFAEFDRVRLIRGTVPTSLNEVDIQQVSYLSIDMNCAQADIGGGDGGD